MTRFSLFLDEIDVSNASFDSSNENWNDSNKQKDPCYSSQYHDAVLEYSDDESDQKSVSCSSSSSSSSIESEPRYSIGRTRFCLSNAESLDQYKRRWGYRTSSSSSSPSLLEDIQPQLFPPLSNYVDPATAPTSALVRMMMKQTPPKTTTTTRQSSSQGMIVQGQTNHEYSNDYYDRGMDQDMDRLATLLQAAAIMERYEPLLQLPSSSSALQLQQQQQYQQEEIDLKIQKEMQWERQRITQEQEQAAQALRMLIRDQETKAQQIRAAEQKLIMIQQQQQQQQQKDEDEKKQQELKAREQQQQQEQLAQKAQAAETKVSGAAVEQEPVVVAAAIPEYLERAQKYKAQLVQLQVTVKPFDTSTDANIKKRRLAMKKIVNGKVNTLAENADKIREVANEVAKAIVQAKAEDESIKEAQNSSAVPPEASRGKRYLVNLLAEKVIVRAQAEGFNGQRGDGFPLAHMLAMVSEEAKDFAVVMAAHIYTVCPTAIPSLPHIAPDASEEELMESLGMLRLKDGKYETFEKFLARTEGIISLVADIMASNPPTHMLLGGKAGAIKWLSRFLDALPEAPQSPLPLLTAPVLDAFLTGAGHMLANTYPNEFRKCLDRITDDIVRRLDESSMGLPSATRLKKTIGGGFEDFKQNLPSKAIAEFYHGAKVDTQHLGGSKSVSATASSPFTSTGMTTATQPSPFGSQPGASNQSFTSPFGIPSNTAPSDGGVFASGSNSLKKQPCKFFAQGHCKFGKNCKFSHETSNAQSSPFGSTANMPNSFASASANSPFQQSAPASSGGSSNISASSNPFNSSTSTAPFGQPPAPAPFGSASGANAITSSPFGQSSGAAPAPFGGASTSPFGQATSTSQPSPFANTAGTNINTFAAAPSPFTASNPSPFSATSSSNAMSMGSSSPFQQTTAPSSSPFATSTSSNSNPFGSTITPSPFGQPTGPSSSAFGNTFGSNPTSAGLNTSSNPFGAPGPAPFGNTFGSSTNNNFSTPFTSGQQQSTNAFVATAPAANFGGFGAAPAPSPFGAPSGGSGNLFGTNSGQQPPTTTNSPFGQGQPTNNPFGHSTSSPSPFTTQQPFGQQSSPFASPSNPTGTTFGTATQPCKFFAEGRCKFGASCRFSHDKQNQAYSGFGRF